MNSKQRATWEGLVQQCRSQSYNSINVASKVRGDAIVAAAELVELVTPELAELLERLGRCNLPYTFGDPYKQRQCVESRETACTLAARIRETLTAEMTNPLHQK